MHQPLHTVSLFTAALPDGDRGGNLTWVRIGTKRPVTLHSFWNQTLGTSARYQDNGNTATELRIRPEFARDKLTELDQHKSPLDWMLESYDVAYKVGYINDTLKGGTKDAGIVLPDIRHLLLTLINRS